MNSNYEKAQNHVEAVKAARHSLSELHASDRPQPHRVAALNQLIGDSLRLADVHATLAVADEIRELRGDLGGEGEPFPRSWERRS